MRADQAGRLLEAEQEVQAEPAPLRQHAVHAGGDVVRQLVEHDLERRERLARPVADDLLVVALQLGAEGERHHALQHGDHDLAKPALVLSEFSRLGRITTRMRRFSTTSSMSTSPVCTLKMWPRLTSHWLNTSVNCMVM